MMKSLTLPSYSDLAWLTGAFASAAQGQGQIFGRLRMGVRWTTGDEFLDVMLCQQTAGRQSQRQDVDRFDRQVERMGQGRGG